MSGATDVVVAGAGLAGACAALALSRTRRVTVLDPRGPGTGATGAAAGLVNPFMGRKARPAWRHDQALDALAEMIGEVEPALWRGTGVVRPARDPKQADVFRQRAGEHADLDWLSGAPSAERWPAVSAPHGSLWVARGGSLDLGAFVRAALAVVAERGGTVLAAGLERWERDDGTLIPITDQGEIRARHLLLALGDGARPFAPLAALPLHRVKGQTVRVARPAAMPAGHPAVSGGRYVVPDGDRVIVGATFEHQFSSSAPDPEMDAGLVAGASRVVPALAGAAVLERRAGVRLTVPTSVSPRRLPLAGEVPGHPGVWVVTGLGAKGALTAPLLARGLTAALDNRQSLPPELWPLP